MISRRTAEAASLRLREVIDRAASVPEVDSLPMEVFCALLTADALLDVPTTEGIADARTLLCWVADGCIAASSTSARLHADDRTTALAVLETLDATRTGRPAVDLR